MIVLINHIEELNRVEVVSKFTPISLGFSDSAEAFVFLSGFTFGLVYDRRIRRDGMPSALKRASYRSMKIYGAYLLVLATLLAMGTLFQHWARDLAFILSLDQPLVDHVIGAILVSNHPYGMPILGFFVLMLPFAVLLTWISHRNWWLACYLSGSLYLYTQLDPAFNLPAVILDRPWFFNPFAWQFLYFIGITMAQDRVPAHAKKLVNAVTLLTTLVVLPAGLIFAMAPQVWNEHIAFLSPKFLGQATIKLSKTNLGPVRLAHFLCVAWLLSKLVSPTIAARPELRHIRMIGRNSLINYSIGLILLYASMVVCAFSAKSPWEVILLETTMLAISFTATSALSTAFRRHRMRRKQAIQPT